jgi:hypothetical protein
MCRWPVWKRWMPIPMAYLLGGLLLPAPGVAQTPRDSLSRVVDEDLQRLIPVWRELGEAARTADSLSRIQEREGKQVPVDTFSVGPFRLISEPRQRRMAEAVFTPVLDDIGSAISGSEDIFEPWLFLVRRAWNMGYMYLEGDSLLSVMASSQFRASALRQLAYGRVGQVMWNSLDEGSRSWLGPPALTFAPESAEWVARELATAPSVAARRCYEGELDWCRTAFDLGQEKGSWELWYSASERQLAVSRIRKPDSDPRRAALWEGCVEFQSFSACDLFLGDEPPEPPLSRTARSSLLISALREGGQGSFSRLRHAEAGSVEGKLVEAAGVPLDTLFARWRRDTLRSRTSAWAGLAKTPVPFLFWLVFLGILATRSTRWRLG